MIFRSPEDRRDWRLIELEEGGRTLGNWMEAARRQGSWGPVREGGGGKGTKGLFDSLDLPFCLLVQGSSTPSSVLALLKRVVALYIRQK